MRVASFCGSFGEHLGRAGRGGVMQFSLSSVHCTLRARRDCILGEIGRVLVNLPAQIASLHETPVGPFQSACISSITNGNIPELGIAHDEDIAEHVHATDDARNGAKGKHIGLEQTEVAQMRHRFNDVHGQLTSGHSMSLVVHIHHFAQQAQTRLNRNCAANFMRK